MVTFLLASGQEIREESYPGDGLNVCFGNPPSARSPQPPASLLTRLADILYLDLTGNVSSFTMMPIPLNLTNTDTFLDGNLKSSLRCLWGDR